MKLLPFLSVTCFIAAIGMAAPAHADSTDDAFLASLHAANITYSDPNKAVGAGKWVCDTVGDGKEMPYVVKALQLQNSALSDEKADKFAAVATNAYCPDAISTTTVGSDTAA